MSVLWVLPQYKSTVLQNQIEIQEKNLSIFLNDCSSGFTASFKLGTNNGDLFIKSKRKNFFKKTEIDNSLEICLFLVIYCWFFVMNVSLFERLKKQMLRGI